MLRANALMQSLCDFAVRDLAVDVVVSGHDPHAFVGTPDGATELEGPLVLGVLPRKCDVARYKDAGGAPDLLGDRGHAAEKLVSHLRVEVMNRPPTSP